MGRVPTVSESILTQAHTAERFNAPSGVMTGSDALSETVAPRSAAFTADSNSAEEPDRFSEEENREDILESQFATVVDV